MEIFPSNSVGAAPLSPPVPPPPLDVEDDEVVEDEEIIQIFLSNNEGDALPQHPSSRL